MLWRCDLIPQYQQLRSEILAAVERVLASGRYVLADEGEAFEEEFARWLGIAHAIGVNSGTDALVLALRALGVGPGDEVITTAFTAIPTLAAIRQVGAIPVLVDIEPDTFLMDLERVPAALGPRTRAVVPVHLFGNVVDVARLRRLIGPDVAIVEDCAQAHGARCGGRPAGTLGDAAAFSFYPTKNLGACGDGGAVATTDPAIAEHLRRLRMYGMVDKDTIIDDGTNSRLDELQAAILRVKLPHLDGWNRRRRELAARYTGGLGSTGFRPQAIRAQVEPVWHVYTGLCPDRSRRDAWLAGLEASSIQANVYYPRGLHQQEPYRRLIAELGLDPPSLPVTEMVCARIIALPFHPELPEAAQDRVMAVVQQLPTPCAASGSR